MSAPLATANNPSAAKPSDIDACLSALMSMDSNGLSDHQLVFEIKKTAEAHSIMLDNVAATKILAFTLMARPKEGRQRIVDVLSEAPRKSEDPMTLILGKAWETQAWPGVFTASHILSTISLRHVRAPIFDTKLRRGVRDHLELSGVSRTLVVGGTSGSGKTIAMLSQPSRDAGHERVVVYITPKNGDSRISDETFGDQSQKDEMLFLNRRREKVLSFVADVITSHLPAETQISMGRLAMPLTVVVALDEMGQFGEAVRGLCAINGADIQEALEARWNMTLRYVKFAVVVAGTGVGRSDDYSRSAFEAGVGSQPGSFAYVDPFNGGHKDANWSIFFSLLSLSSPNACEGLKRRAPPQFRCMVMGNARMAAVLGTHVGDSCKGITDEADRYKLLCSLDLCSFLGPAIIRFKSLNSLQMVKYDGLWDLLLQGLRMHLFPYAQAPDSAMFEARYGLVLNRTLSTPAAGRSPVGLPPFSVMLLSMLTGLPMAVRSNVSADAFEEYAFALLLLVGSAAGSARLLTRILNQPTHKLGPLLTASEFSQSASVGTKPKVLSIFHDMARDGFLAPSESQGSATADDTDERKFLATVEAKLELLRSELKASPSAIPFAIFRSPREYQFCNVFALLGDTLYLIQCNDSPDTAAIDWPNELWKMGSMGDEARKAFANNYSKDEGKTEDIAQIRKLLSSIMAMWREVTREAITTVRPYFVYPSEGTNGVDSTKEFIDSATKYTLKAVRHVNIGDVEFLEFEQQRQQQDDVLKHRQGVLCSYRDPLATLPPTSDLLPSAAVCESTQPERKRHRGGHRE